MRKILFFTLSIIIISCSSGNNLVKKKNVKQYGDSLISANETLKKEKVKLMELLFKDYGIDSIVLKEIKQEETNGSEERMFVFNLSIKEVCSLLAQKNNGKLLHITKDSLHRVNDFLLEEKGRLIERILKDNEVELTEIKGKYLEKMNAMEKRDAYSQIPVDSIDSLLQWVKEISF